MCPSRFVSFSRRYGAAHFGHGRRSEEHTSELQSQSNLVCRLLLEKKKHHALLPHLLSRTEYQPFLLGTRQPHRLHTVSRSVSGNSRHALCPNHPYGLQATTIVTMT